MSLLQYYIKQDKRITRKMAYGQYKAQVRGSLLPLPAGRRSSCKQSSPTP